jgi:hypothetical protein
MKYAHRPAIGGFQAVALNPLMLPDSLQEFFRGRGLVIVQPINGTTAFSPHGIKFFDAGVHAGIFNGGGRQCQAESSLRAQRKFISRHRAHIRARQKQAYASNYFNFERNRTISCLFINRGNNILLARTPVFRLR